MTAPTPTHDELVTDAKDMIAMLEWLEAEDEQSRSD